MLNEIKHAYETEPEICEILGRLGDVEFRALFGIASDWFNAGDNLDTQRRAGAITLALAQAVGLQISFPHEMYVARDGFDALEKEVK